MRRPRFASLLVCTLGVTLAFDAQAMDPVPIACGAKLPRLGEVPANAPALPIEDLSSQARTTLTLSTAPPATASVAVGPGELGYFAARLSEAPGVGSLTLRWSIECDRADATRPGPGTWDVNIVPARPLPSGPIGTVTLNGPSGSVAVSEASRAFSRLSIFTIRYRGAVLETAIALDDTNEVSSVSGALAGGMVERVDVGYLGGGYRPGHKTPGVLDLTFPLEAASPSICRDAGGASTSADLTLEQRIFGTDVVAATSDVRVTVDCAKADEAARAAQPVSIDGACALTSGRRSQRDGVGASAALLLGMLVLRRRAKRD